MSSEQGAGEGIPARRRRRVPAWVEVVLIIALLGAAVFSYLDDHVLRALLLGVGGLAFGGSFVLRRMVGDEYGRA